MKNLDTIAEDLFNKIRGRFPSVTIGDADGNVTNLPAQARFFDFDFKEGATILGKISVSLNDDSVAVMYNNDIAEGQDQFIKDRWYGFLKELRTFAKKRLLNFDTRNINKSNLDRRDYKFLAQNTGDSQMAESKMYGTSKTSYQDMGLSRILVKHNSPVNVENPAGRTQNINAIYIESADGERFKYPYKHLTGARAMARHVAEGGNPYDDFGKHIVGLSEEMAKLRKFKNYMNRSGVMAEGLGGYMDAVSERIATVKKTIENLQKKSHYTEALDNFETTVMEDVPEDVAENWIDQLTVKQFNEELKDVFPFVYKVVSEYTKAKELSPEELVSEGRIKSYKVKRGDTLYSIAKRMVQHEMMGMSVDEAVQMIADENGIKDPAMIQPGMELMIPYVIGAVGGDPETGEPITRGLPPEEVYSPEDLERLMNQDIHSEEIENAFEELMGQFAEEEIEEGHMPGYQNYHCKDCGCQMHNCKPGCNCEHDSHDEKGSWWVDKNGNGVPDAMEGIEPNEQKTPVTEFILSMYDRETGQFPKGETAVLTAVEKDYGEQYIDPAKAFIEAINAKFEEFNGYKDPDLMDDEEMDESGILYKAGVKKYGKKGMQAIQSAAGKGASHEELGKIKDKHMKDDLDAIRRIAGI